MGVNRVSDGFVVSREEAAEVEEFNSTLV